MTWILAIATLALAVYAWAPLRRTLTDQHRDRDAFRLWIAGVGVAIGATAAGPIVAVLALVVAATSMTSRVRRVSA